MWHSPDHSQLLPLLDKHLDVLYLKEDPTIPFTVNFLEQGFEETVLLAPTHTLNGSDDKPPDSVENSAVLVDSQPCQTVNEELEGEQRSQSGDEGNKELSIEADSNEVCCETEEEEKVSPVVDVHFKLISDFSEDNNVDQKEEDSKGNASIPNVEVSTPLCEKVEKEPKSISDDHQPPSSGAPVLCPSDQNPPSKSPGERNNHHDDELGVSCPGDPVTENNELHLLADKGGGYLEDVCGYSEDKGGGYFEELPSFISTFSAQCPDSEVVTGTILERTVLVNISPASPQYLYQDRTLVLVESVKLPKWYLKAAVC